MKEIIIKEAKWWSRVIAWAGTFIFAFAQVWEMIKNNSSPMYIVCLSIFLAALYITGILDLIQKRTESLRK